jgi:hypothetical protein
LFAHSQGIIKNGNGTGGFTLSGTTTGTDGVGNLLFGLFFPPPLISLMGTILVSLLHQIK